MSGYLHWLARTGAAALRPAAPGAPPARLCRLRPSRHSDDAAAFARDRAAARFRPPSGRFDDAIGRSATDAAMPADTAGLRALRRGANRRFCRRRRCRATPISRRRSAGSDPDASRRADAEPPPGTDDRPAARRRRNRRRRHARAAVAPAAADWSRSRRSHRAWRRGLPATGRPPSRPTGGRRATRARRPHPHRPRRVDGRHAGRRAAPRIRARRKQPMSLEEYLRRRSGRPS